jgi:hypothetical protein
MGSFLARAAVATYPGDYDALIIMGTGGTNPLSTMGLGITSIIGKIKGQKYISNDTLIIPRPCFGFDADM